MILLQEVSVGWANKLHVFFRKHGYIFITAHYDRKYSDYMGVAIAFPQEAKMVDMKRVVMGSQIRDDFPEETWFQWIFYNTREKLGYQDERPKEIRSIAERAKLRFNVAGKLEKMVNNFGLLLIISRSFKTPLLMNLHDVKLAKNGLQI